MKTWHVSKHVKHKKFTRNREIFLVKNNPSGTTGILKKLRVVLLKGSKHFEGHVPQMVAALLLLNGPEDIEELPSLKERGVRAQKLCLLCCLVLLTNQ